MKGRPTVRTRNFWTSVAGVVLAIALASSATPAHADKPQPNSQAASPTETGQRIKDYKGWTVVHWGQGYSSGPLDASIASNRDPANFSAPLSTNAIGFKCTLFVGAVILKSGKMQAGTEQTCTGAFSEKFVTAGFARKNLIGAWVAYGKVSESAHTHDAIDDSTWTIGCPGGSKWYYRLDAVPWARSSETGVLTHGPVVHGVQSGKFACGT